MVVEVKWMWNVRREFIGKKNKIKIEKKRFLERTARDAIEIWIKFTPIKTWKLKEWFKYKVTSEKLEVWNNKKYYKFIDEGTKQHFIRPKKWKVLKFSKNGKNVYSRWHMVKGIKAHNITDKTSEELMGWKMRINLNNFMLAMIDI